MIFMNLQKLMMEPYTKQQINNCALPNIRKLVIFRKFYIFLTYVGQNFIFILRTYEKNFFVQPCLDTIITPWIWIPNAWSGQQVMPHPRWQNKGILDSWAPFFFFFIRALFTETMNRIIHLWLVDHGTPLSRATRRNPTPRELSHLPTRDVEEE